MSCDGSMIGFVSIVLHWHIPYVRKSGEWPFGENWFFEALAETYIPLIAAVEELTEIGINPKMTFNITPVLLEQLSDEYMKEKFEKYLEEKISLIDKDLEKYADPELRKAILHVKKFYTWIKDKYGEYGGDIIAQLKKLQDNGFIEIITSAATHAYLPLLGCREAIDAQLDTGVRTYLKYFDKRPRGIWLPEMAYRPRGEWILPPDGRKVYREGIEEFLVRHGYKYFFVEYHVLEGGKHIATYPFPADLKYPAELEKKFIGETLRPYFLPVDGRDVAVFARNKSVSVQVWSADWGYPGDYWYREFHRVSPISGMKYWRITDKALPLIEKAPYDPEKALERVHAHADHFTDLLYKILKDFEERTGEKGIVVGAYDAELFGHWWYEGVKWLIEVYKRLSNFDITPITPNEYLDKYVETKHYVELPEGSWGLGGGHWTWWNDSNKWTWSHIHSAEEKMKELANIYRKNDLLDRIIEQAMRELHLMESSDWQFLITTGTAGNYPVKRFKEHVNRFNFLADLAFKINKGEKMSKEEEEKLKEIEEIDKVFTDLNPKIFL